MKSHSVDEQAVEPSDLAFPVNRGRMYRSRKRRDLRHHYDPHLLCLKIKQKFAKLRPMGSWQNASSLRDSCISN